MQYGIGVRSYNKRDKDKNIKLVDKPIKLICMFLMGILVSRVVIYLNAESLKGIAPFGIAYFLSVIFKSDKKSIFISFIGTILGYLTISVNMYDKYANIMLVTILFIYSFGLYKIKKNLREYISYIVVMMLYTLYGIFMNKYDIGISLTFALINSIIILPVYYVIRYGISCMEEINTNYFFSTEEMISISLIICFMISGIGDVAIQGINIRDVIAYITVILIAYVDGAEYGAAIGISMGIVIGINTGSIIENTAFFGVAGLVSGIFKDTGKVFTFLSYLIMFLALSVYSKQLDLSSLLEVVIAGGIFFIIPKFISKTVEVEINSDKKKEHIDDGELNEFKEAFSEKIFKLQRVLKSISSTLHDIGGNDELMYKNKSTALIENLADRICPKCSRCDKCWNRDFNITYSAFETLIKSYENGKVIFPNELEKICLYKFDLIKEVERIINILNSKEALKDRLSEERILLADHVDSISSSIGEMLVDFKKKTVICEDVERVVKHSLNKNSIYYNNVFCYRDESEKIKVKFNTKNCDGSKYCVKDVLPILNEVMNKKMCIGGNGCKINPNTGECSVIFEESPKFKIVSYGSIAVKDGEKHTGDTFSFGKTDNGKYMTLISDGMGSGPQAEKESKATVDLIESFLEAGFTKENAINMINSIMSMKFEENERFSTLDLNVVDLYSGIVSFIKIGAAASFIKRGKNVKPIVSNMPPFGLVDKVEIEEVKENIKNGDLIITLSDGILDINKENLGQYSWLEDYLVDCLKDPKELAENIIEEAKKRSGNRVKDDMTVVVSKVYSMA